MLKLIRNVVVASFLSVIFSLSHAAVDINTADAAALAEGVTGIGPSKAQAIIEYRTANGRFASIDDLVKVQGIGFKTLDRIREFVMVAPTAAVTTPASSDTASAASQPALQ